MFSWLRRKPVTPATPAEPPPAPPNPLPRRYFISHSYQDKEPLALLLATLPPHVTPVIFPEITVDPMHFISDALLKAITATDALVYLQGGQSAASLWVNFERRYARRRGMTVFGFDPETRTLTEDKDQPSNFVMVLRGKYVGDDLRHINAIEEWLHYKRNVAFDDIELWPGRWETFDTARWRTDQTALDKALEDYSATGDNIHVDKDMRKIVRCSALGGSVLLLLSNDVCTRPWPSADVFLRGASLVSKLPHPEMVQTLWLEAPDVPKIEKAFARIGERPDNTLLREIVLQSARRAAGAQEHVITPEGEINANRLDNLLVRLEHVAHQKRTRAVDTKLEHQIELQQRARDDYVDRLRRKLEKQALGRKTLDIDPADF